MYRIVSRGRFPPALALVRIRFFSCHTFARNAGASPIAETPQAPAIFNSDIEIDDWDRGGRTKTNSLSPLYASMRLLMDKYNGNVCFIQVGSFYELYFEHAEVYGPKLGLKVATRKTTGFTIPMAGFPVYQLQKFVKILVQDIGVSCAIIDQYPENKVVGEKLVHRKVSRIVSPGTLVEETFLNYNQNNYLAAISLPTNCTVLPHDPDMVVGISWIDLSVGEFYVQQTTLGDLMSDIARIGPSEIILHEEFLKDNLVDGKWFTPLQDLRKYFIRYHKTTYNELKLSFKSNLNVVRKKLGTFSVRENAAMNMVLSYININLPERNPSLDLPIQYWNEKYLQMDSRTREALELTERSTGGTTSVVGSLLNTIKQTVTPSGTRLLTQWIKSPIMDVEELKYRQSFVKLFIDESVFRAQLKAHLAGLGDFVRSAQRLALGTGDTVTHMRMIAEGLNEVSTIRQRIIEEARTNTSIAKVFKPYLEKLDVPDALAKKILETLIEEDNDFEQSDIEESLTEESEVEAAAAESIEYASSGSYKNSSVEKYRSRPLRSTSTESSRFVVKPTYSEELQALHTEYEQLKQSESDLLQEIKDQLISFDPRLKVSKKDQHGRFTDIIHISGKQSAITNIHNELGHDIRERRKASLLYKPKAWSELQYKMHSHIGQITEIENRILDELRANITNEITNIRKIGKLVDFLDITMSFSTISEELSLVCPKFTKTSQLNIVDGRHIVVETGLRTVSDNFTTNDTKLTPASNLWVVTGPNMGGKSTFLRQNALIVIMAQIGCFVPASKASMGLVDKIFTRIGASDDLFSDLSTFMVEMVEVSNILKNATPQSLAIVDEVGRGTSGKEGLAISYATLLGLVNENKCRTLFATHFGHELKELLEKDQMGTKKIRFVRTKVIEETNESGQLRIIIDHKLEDGISERSFALEVAQTAGFPPKILSHATRALNLIN